MNIAHDMKELVHEMVSSYEDRIAAVGEIINNAHQSLEDLKVERRYMSSQLKESLAAGESLRKKDFDKMMRDILENQDEREEHVREVLKNYIEEQKETAGVLKSALEDRHSTRVAINFKALLEDIQTKQKLTEKNVIGMLRDFREEHEEITGSLRSLLARREKTRLEDFKKTLDSIRKRQKEQAEQTRLMLMKYRKELKEKTNSMLNEFRRQHKETVKECKEMSGEWQRFAAEMAERKRAKGDRAKSLIRNISGRND